jgi:DNA repair protein RadC
MFRSLGGLDRELFLTLLLDTKQRLTGVGLVSVGTLDASLVHPREVFKPAVVGNAAAVICVHNHPSGDPTPSREDHEITTRLAEAGRVLGIPLLDHLVIAVDGYTSFKDRGFL